MKRMVAAGKIVGQRMELRVADAEGEEVRWLGTITQIVRLVRALTPQPEVVECEGCGRPVDGYGSVCNRCMRQQMIDAGEL